MQEDVYQGDGLNLYAYCGNNPVGYYDPSGYYDEDLFQNRNSYDDEGKSSKLKIDMLKTMINGEVPSNIKVGSHQAQHIIPGSLTKHPTIAISGYMTNSHGNGIFDKDFTRNSNKLHNYLKNKNVSPADFNTYVSDKTHHGVLWGKGKEPATAFNHKAYNDYVQFKLDQIAKEEGLWDKLNKYNGNGQSRKEEQYEAVRKNMSEEDMTKLRDKVQNLNEFLRKKNQDGIDLYLKHPKNTSGIANYFDDGSKKGRTQNEAMEYYIRKNFGEEEARAYKQYLEENKSMDCGGKK